MSNVRIEEELLKEKEKLIDNVLIDINNQYLKEKVEATIYGQSFPLLDEQDLRKQLITGSDRSQWIYAQEEKQHQIQPIPAAIAYESTPKITESGFSFWKKPTPSSDQAPVQENSPVQDVKDNVKPK